MGSQKTSGLRHRFRQGRHRRKKRPNLRGHRLRQRRRREPKAGNPPLRRHTRRTPVDNLQEGHGHHAKARASGELFQDNRRQRRERAHRRWGLHHHTLRKQRDRSWDSHSRLQAHREHQHQRLAGAFRVLDEIGRRRNLYL
ncbi:hypothetical protein V8G54_011935 [Vigna mungo]|uniref:Uncharacterized protein n=1 Tax=Vigna mungo TaxID=3915 RepID=A0AAQ3NQD8_VIGMU